MSDDVDQERPGLKRQIRAANSHEREALVDALPYEVGFGKPPKRTRFAPGQSGNRKGRPKGSLNFATILDTEALQTAEVSERGRRRKMSKIQIGLRQLFNKAASGDAKAIMAAIELLRKAGKINDAPTLKDPAIDQRDLDALGGLFEVFKSAAVPGSSNSTDPTAGGCP